MSKIFQDPHSCCRFECGADDCENWCDWEKDKYNCTMPSFIGASMLNVDMGLYLDFDIETGDPSDGGKGHGRPKGCPGLTRPSWIDSKTKNRKGTVYPNEVLPQFTEEKYLEYSDQKMNRYDSHQIFLLRDQVNIFFSEQSKRHCKQSVQHCGSWKTFQRLPLEQRSDRRRTTHA